jgi:hypothetical protein
MSVVVPRPLIVWSTQYEDEPLPVKIVPHTDTFPLNPKETVLDGIDHPLKWDDLSADVDTWEIESALRVYLAGSLGGEWSTEGTGGGCSAFSVFGLIGARRVECLVTDYDGSSCPVLGQNRGIIVGFYDEERDEEGECFYFGSDSMYGAPMTADVMCQNIADTFARVGFVPAPVLI